MQTAGNATRSTTAAKIDRNALASMKPPPASLALHHQRDNQQRDDVDDLDERVDRRAGGVLVGIAHGVAGHGRLVRVRAFAAEMIVLDVLLGVVPGAAA